MAHKNCTRRAHSFRCLCESGNRFCKSMFLRRRSVDVHLPSAMYDLVDNWTSSQRVDYPDRRTLSKIYSLGSSQDSCDRQSFFDDDCPCMSHSKTARRRRFRSKSGFYLAVMPNGQVLGVRDTNNPYIDLDVIPCGADLVKIWGVEAELFLMIDDAGLLRGTDVDSTECIFEETLTQDFHSIYYSAMYTHRRWCLGLKSRSYSQYRPSKLGTTDCSFLVEVVRRRASSSSIGSDDRISIL